MEKYNIENLYLELTRMCNLDCKHCLRGPSENKFMSDNTLENIFKYVDNINTLLLTGGEPLIALKQINKIINIININNIKIERIAIITNGTILSDKVLNLLNELKELCDNFELYISGDKFHLLELDRKGLLDKRNSNLEIYKEIYDAREYNPGNDRNSRLIIASKGKACELSDEDMLEINNYGKKTNYVLANNICNKIEIHKFNIPYFRDNTVFGNLNIDVNGNVVEDNLSFREEDKEVYSGVNINNNGLLVTIKNIIQDKLLYNKEYGCAWLYFYEDKLKLVKSKIK